MRAKYLKSVRNVEESPTLDCTIYPENMDGCIVRNYTPYLKEHFSVEYGDSTYLVEDKLFDEFSKYFDTKAEYLKIEWMKEIKTTLFAKSDKIISEFEEEIPYGNRIVCITKDKQWLSLCKY